MSEEKIITMQSLSMISKSDLSELQIAELYNDTKMIPYGSTLTITKISSINFDHEKREHLGMLTYSAFRQIDPKTFRNAEEYRSDEQVCPVYIVDSDGNEYKVPELLWSILTDIISEIMYKQSMQQCEIFPHEFLIDDKNKWIDYFFDFMSDDIADESDVLADDEKTETPVDSGQSETPVDSGQPEICVCGEEGRILCKKCKIQKYCTTKCMRKDLRQHLNVCKPSSNM
jgi:hypothetical protein